MFANKGKGLMYVDGQEFRELEASITKVRKACKYLDYGCRVCLVVFFVIWILVLVALFTNLATSQVNPYEILYSIISGFVIILLFLTGVQSFSSVAKGQSPFTMNQVNRFRFAALLLVLLALIEAFLSASFSYSLVVAGVDVAAVGGRPPGAAEVNINLMPLFFAAMLYGVSILFRYGVLLQRLTDETE